MMVSSLQQSIKQYRKIVEHAQQLDQLLAKGDPEQLQDYTARLQTLQTEAGLNDQQLLTGIARDSVRWQAHPLFHQRMQLLEQIVEMNKLLLPRVRGMMSVTAAELTQLREGRVAVSGYHQAPNRGKKSIRGVG
ncbi:MAG: hypothetical protein GXP51_08500 [Deltaproteobacteria bacterium]|nr:hypothetical protein [Deltaproteobacteria bacterium]